MKRIRRAGARKSRPISRRKRKAQSASLATVRKVLRIEADAIARLIGRVDRRFERAIDILYSCRGRVVVTGMGKSGLVAQKISATLSSTGTPSFFLHPAEAHHGDLGRLVRGDALLALSHGGETEEILLLFETVKRLGVPLLSFTGNPKSTLARASDVALDVSIPKEACPLGLAPTASTTAALAVGDALAMALLEKRGFKEEEFARLHPGGELGVQLRRVEQVMHTGDRIPRVSPQAKLPDVIYEMSKKGLGITTVVDKRDRLLGVISDGDLRRFLQKKGDRALALTAKEAMTRRPISLPSHEPATRALNIMESRKITSLVVTGPRRRVEGLIHIHDLWTTQMF